MRRFGRILRYTLIVLSSLLLATTLALWLRAQWRSDWLSVQFLRREGRFEALIWHQLNTERDVLVYDYIRQYYTPNDAESMLSDYLAALRRPIGHWEAGLSRPPFRGNRINKSFWHHLGFTSEEHFAESHPAKKGTWRSTTVPFWFIALMCGIGPGSWGAAFIRRSRRARRDARDGTCLNCGYDLRASRDRCPECGAVPSDANAGERKAAP